MLLSQLQGKLVSSVALAYSSWAKKPEDANVITLLFMCGCQEISIEPSVIWYTHVGVLY